MGLRDYTRARELLEENMVLTEELGTDGDRAEVLEKLGKVAYLQRDYEGAHLLYRRSLSLFQELGDKMGIARCLVDLAGLSTATMGKGQNASTARLLSAAQQVLDTVGFQLEPEDRDLFDGYIATVRARLSERAFEEAWAEGQAMTVTQAITQAYEVAVPGRPAPREHYSPRHSTKSEFGGLTRREREVAILVSQGKSNRVIAEELIVSERTVEGHVNNIFAKLGFRSRAQVAAWAVEKGLVKLSDVQGSADP
jgi:non-specific serine/threonine protein kinase